MELSGQNHRRNRDNSGGYTGNRRKHLRLARDSLGAGNTAQAILKAHLTNQIFSGDIPDETER